MRVACITAFIRKWVFDPRHRGIARVILLKQSKNEEGDKASAEFGPLTPRLFIFVPFGVVAVSCMLFLGFPEEEPPRFKESSVIKGPIVLFGYTETSANHTERVTDEFKEMILNNKMYQKVTISEYS